MTKLVEDRPDEGGRLIGTGTGEQPFILKVKQQHLNLWSQREAFLQVLVTIVLVSAGLTFIHDAVSKYFSIPTGRTTVDASSIVIGILGAALTFPYFLRNAIVMRWSARKDFVFMHSVQGRSHVLYIISFLAFISALLVSLPLPPSQRSSTIGISSEITLGAALIVSRLSEMFRQTFHPNGLGLLCLETYSQGAKSGLEHADRKYLEKGLKIVERVLRRYGVRFPHERLALAFNMLLLSGMALNEHLENLMSILSDPTSTNLKRAVESARSLLGYTREYLEVGMQIPYSSWKRFTAPATLGVFGNVVYLVIVLVLAILAFLGIRI